MLTLCKNDKTAIQKLIKEKNIDAIVPSNSDFVDDIILAMAKDGIIDCLNDSFLDKRRHNAYVPFKRIMALSIAAKMKTRTSLTDIPYAIQDHRTLAELGFNIINHNKDELFTEGTLRYLLGKYTADELVRYYNDVVQNRISVIKDIEPNIHILDCTKIAVNINNENYENSSIAKDRTGAAMRGYKLGSLRGVYKDTGIFEEIRFSTVKTHDFHVCEDMLKTTPCLKPGDILINDRGFLSRSLINYLKINRGVDTYVPLRANMTASDHAISCAKLQNDWVSYTDKAGRHRLITSVCDIGELWTTKNPSEYDVPINTCVIWEPHEDLYWVFVTTDLSKTPIEIMDMYDLRVEIEEDYRQLKDFWKLEDFKSTKYNMIVFHIICVLFGYLFYQLYINSAQGRKYLGKSLPVVVKNYKTKFLNYFVIYSGECFSCMSLKEFFEFRDNCEKDVQEYLLKFFD